MVACQGCGVALPEGARFCAACGTAAVVGCPDCGTANAAENRFCTTCGAALAERTAPAIHTPPDLAEKIRASSRGLEGERKQITVLFADVAGFTRMSAALDPEETHGIMRRSFDLMLAEIHRYEGTVSQFLGDGMLALFGAPLAHEDHALRACLSGLGVQEALARYQAELRESRGIDFRVRVGLNSGLVVVGSVGVDLTMDYLAVGDTVNLAARMQSLAQPGSVVMSEDTHRLVKGLVVVRDLGPQEVKGKDDAVRVYEVVRPARSRSRVDVGVDTGLTPFVGRLNELSILQTRVDDARHRRGQMVLLRGDPGIGKSRLLHELRNAVGGAEDTVWLTGRCVSYGAGIPYLPIIDLLKELIGVDESDPEPLVSSKIDTQIAPAAARYIRALLGLPVDDAMAQMDPLLRKAETLDALRAEILRRAGDMTHVLVVEDLHWADQASLEFLSYLADAVSEDRILLLLTFRSSWEHPFGSRSFLTSVDLATLSPESSIALAASLLGGCGLPEPLLSLVLAKTEGNPFFVEEVVHSLLEDGWIAPANSGYVLVRPIDELRVPDTVEGVLMARLDRLDDEPKRALQTASVIGREFTVRVLERTANLERGSEETLRRLKAVELIYERSLYPELAYMFKHALTHDVAYRSLLLERRRELHRVVASAIEELYADRLGEHVELVAYHAERGEAWEQAYDYLMRSGHKALSAFAGTEAVHFFTRALEISERASVGDEDILALHAVRGAALEVVSDWTAAALAFSDMLEAGLRLADRAQIATALYNRSFALFWAHRFEESRADADEAKRIADELDSPQLAVGSLLTISFIEGVTGELDGAATHIGEIRQMMTRFSDPVTAGFLDYWDGLLRHWRGDEQTALSTHRRGIEVGRVGGAPIVVVANSWTAGLALCGSGRYEEAIAALEEGIALTERLGERIYRCRLLNTLGWTYMDICNWSSATLYNRQSYDTSLGVGDPEIIRNAALNLADIALEQNDVEEARRLLTLVEEGSRRVGVWGEEFMKWRYTQHLNASLAELALADRDPERALDHADACVQAAAATDAIRNLVKGRRLRARALRELTRHAEAERESEQAVALAERYGNPAQLWRTYEVAGRAGDALAVLETIAAGLGEDRGETLLASAQLARLRGLRG